MSNIYPPRARRFVDGTLVIRPRYYADPGPEGYYPELQYPIQTRLGIRYSSFLQKQVYIQLNAVFMSGLRPTYTEKDLRNILNDISTNIRFDCFHPHKSRNGKITCMEFQSAKQADEVIIFANTHRTLFSDGDFIARYSDWYARGVNAESTRDILLVREELALSPPYTPRSFECFSFDPRKSSSAEVRRRQTPKLPAEDYESTRVSSSSYHPYSRRQHPSDASYSQEKFYTPSRAVNGPVKRPSSRSSYSSSFGKEVGSISSYQSGLKDPNMSGEFNGFRHPETPLTPICRPLIERIAMCSLPGVTIPSPRHLVVHVEKAFENTATNSYSSYSQNHQYSRSHHTAPHRSSKDRKSRSSNHRSELRSKTSDKGLAKHSSHSKRERYRHERGENEPDGKSFHKSEDGLGAKAHNPHHLMKSLESFKHHFESASSKPAHKPRYVALSVDKKELIFACTRQEAKEALASCVSGSVEKEEESRVQVDSVAVDNADAEERLVEQPRGLCRGANTAEIGCNSLVFEPEGESISTLEYFIDKEGCEMAQTVENMEIKMTGHSTLSTEIRAKDLTDCTEAGIQNQDNMNICSISSDRKHIHGIHKISELPSYIRKMMGIELCWTLTGKLSDKWDALFNKTEIKINVDGEDENKKSSLRVLKLESFASEQEVEGVLSERENNDDGEFQDKMGEKQRRIII
ncbi:uncharacterized protein IL334_000132 [Kwoniella shivajii]|uniref:RRM domain-containing protein n=1 Tax=Kwoniella shivajii TaxID=564305 RepID=A0ABZ1CPS8_9TREE|nr:hypothetical protein IL334_000132 [Kwoniella shivajii]